MSIGYFDDLADANLYFTDERLETSAWDELVDIYKTKVMAQAFNRIYYHADFDLPAVADATAAQLIVLKKANAEMAYYMALHMADEDKRSGLRAQGVTEAGIVKEKYTGFSEVIPPDAVPFPPIVKQMLSPWHKYNDQFYSVDIDRDEDEEVSEDVTEF